MALTLLIAVLAALLTNDLAVDAYVFETIEVPRESTVSGQALTRKIFDDLLYVEGTARTSFRSAGVEPSWTRVDFSLKASGVEITLRTVADVLRELLRKPRRRVAGELIGPTADQKSWKIMLHVTGAPPISCLETPDLSFTSHDCAERLEEVISPYVAAVYYFQHRRWADSDRAVLPVLRNGARDRKWGHNLRGQLLLKKGDEKGALAEYEAAIALDSRFSLPWANKGNIFLRKEDYKEAERLYRVAIRLQESAVAFKNLADALMRQGKLDEAERLFLRSIEIDRTMWEAYFGLGEVHIRRDDLDGAEVWLQHARQLALIKTDPLVREAAVFMDLEKYEAASARFVRATRLDEHNKAAWSGLAASLALLKRYDEAYEAALKGLPDLFDAAQAAKNPSAALMAWSVSKVILDPYEIDEESTFIKLFLLIESSRKGGAPASSDKAGGSTNQELTRQQ